MQWFCYKKASAYGSRVGTVGGMVQEKESRKHCSSWTVLHAQCTTSVLSSGFPLSQGNAKTLDRWGGKTKHRLIFYFFRNTSAKNYHNLIVYVNIASQRWDVFWDTVYMLLFWIKFWSIHVYKTFSMYLFAITERDCAKRLPSTYFEQGGCYGS